MMKDRYAYVAVFSYDEDGISIEFPDLPGCLSCADKDDTEEALKNAEEVLALFIWSMEQDGDPFPEPTPASAISLDANQTATLIEVFMPPFRKEIEKINRKK